ncbi:hypothetical protein ACX80O_15420 [Arthrobacter sp. Hz1]
MHYRKGGPRASIATWDKFKSETRKIDRDSLLLQAAATTAEITLDTQPIDEARQGITPWNIADVARTSLAWGSFARPKANINDLKRLCNLNANLVDEGLGLQHDPGARLARILTRIFFEQFPGQRSIMTELSRSILLFGSASQHLDDFEPEAMSEGWFETVTNGLTFDEYVSAIFLIDVITRENQGRFSLDWLDAPNFHGLEEVISFDAVRRTFVEHLGTTIKDFKKANRGHQGDVPAPQKKYTFNPLSDKPFITDVADVPVAPWVQAIVSKTLPPAIYHLARPVLGDRFTRDLGSVFQQYTGRQLALIGGERQVVSEVNYGTKHSRVDSCDWFLELPDKLVLIECKARQPIESFRIAGADWMNSIEASINRGIRQLDRSNRDIDQISATCSQIDSRKPRFGLVVTLEPFYLGQNWVLAESLQKSDFPVGVVSIAELESLVMLTSDELAVALQEASDESESNYIFPNPASVIHADRENPLIEATWDSIPFFRRAENIIARYRSERRSD